MDTNILHSFDTYQNEDGSFNFAGLPIKPGDTYVDAYCKITPLRQRVLSGLAVKIILVRLKKTHGEYVDDSEEDNLLKEFNRVSNMTDEEFNQDKENNK